MVFTILKTKKGDKIDVEFHSEKDIFDYLGIQYVEPEKETNSKF